jgi:hypothetical protein
MTKEEVLQKANDYCTEKAYTAETLTDDFKDKFSDFFAKRYAETSADDENMIADLKFNLDTAFSATSKGLTSKQKAFETKENEYKNQIAELNKKIGNTQQQQQQQFELPDDVKQQLAELQKFKTDEAKKAKFREIVDLAKKDIREDLAGDFDIFVKDYEVKDDVTAEEQAKKEAEEKAAAEKAAKEALRGLDWNVLERGGSLKWDPGDETGMGWRIQMTEPRCINPDILKLLDADLAKGYKESVHSRYDLD